MKKTLSFIIPAYNCQQYLDKCIESFLDPEILDDLDIIIVNDGSKDKTAEIADKYCKKYPDSVRLINQENKGHGGALNTGCTAAVGKYLKVVDADDWVEKENLSEFVRLLKECDCDVVLTHHYTKNISTNEIKKWKSYPLEFGKSYTFEKIMSDWKCFERSLTFHGITYHTEFYHKHAIQLSEHVFYEDHEYATIPCCYANTIVPFDLFIYHYRIGDVAQSVSDENQLKRISHTCMVLERFITEYRNLNLAEHSSGRTYFCMKAQGLLLSYIKTVLLVEKNKRKGRKLADEMIRRFQEAMPLTYEMAVKQYKVFRLMNYFYINKNVWEKILDSRLYRMVKRKHDFN